MSETPTNNTTAEVKKPQSLLAVCPDGELLESATLQTERGPIYFRRRLPVERLQKMTLAEGLGIFFRYNIERQKETLLKIAAMEYGNIVVAHTAEDVVIGYITMHPIDESERWNVMNQAAAEPKVYEFGAIEVSRLWRGLGLSKRLMQAAFKDDSWLDNKIITSTEFSWHWDYEEIGLNKFQYRKMLKNVIASAGFQQLDTDEPNVMMDATNMFMVRIGPKVDPELMQKFFALLHKNNTWGL